MKNENRTINLNGQIENVQYTLITDGPQPAVRLCFSNVSRRTVVAVRMQGTAKNAFGEPVAINGQNEFIVDFYGRTAPGEAGEMTADLPSPAIRSLDMKWIKISFEDGAIEEPLPPRIIEFEVPVFSDSSEDQEDQRLLNARYHTPFNNLAVELEEGWVCTCGGYNEASGDACARCGLRRTDAFEASRAETREKLRDEEKERVREEERRRAEANMAAYVKKRRIRWIVGLALAALCVILLIVKVSSDKKKEREAYMKGVRAFSSVEEMQSSINGRYKQESLYKTAYYNPPATVYLVINGDSATTSYITSCQEFTREVHFTPKDGRFQIGYETFVVKTNGTISDGLYTYTKVSSSTDPIDVQAMYDKLIADQEAESRAQQARYETASQALSFTVTSVRNNGSYVVCEGKVTNGGLNSYRYIKVKGSFVDSFGTVLDTDWTYAIGSEGLAPGETTTFRLSVKANRSIKDCKLSMYD